MTIEQITGTPLWVYLLASWVVVYLVLVNDEWVAYVSRWEVYLA